MNPPLASAIGIKPVGVAVYFYLNDTPIQARWLTVKEKQTLASLLAAVPQVCTVIGMIWWGRRSDKAQERRWHTTLPMLCAAGGWLLTAYSTHPAVQLLGVCLASTGAYTAMSIFWTTPDHALSFAARALGIAVINATGNLGSALNPLIVGIMKDITNSYQTGLLYAAALLVVGAIIFMLLPIPRTSNQNLVPLNRS